MHNRAKRALCLLVSLSILFTLASILTLSTTAVMGSNEPMIAIGDKFMIVQTASGELWGWGDNANKVLGEAQDESITAPIKIELPSDITSVSVSAGTDHVLMLASDGNVYAWGRNDHGQLGFSTANESLTAPTLVEGLADKHIIAVSAGRFFSLALSDSGHVYSFGANDKLQLGYETENRFSATPALIEGGLKNVFIEQINAGYESSVAIDKNGLPYLWGSEDNNVLGTDVSSSGELPFPLPNTKTTTPIVCSALSINHSAFLLSDGTLGFMGFNNHGQYGNDEVATIGSKRFKTIDTASLNVTAIAVSDAETVLLTASGKVFTAGSRIPNDDSASATLVPLFGEDTNVPVVIAIAAGYQNGAIIAQDGSVWTWGDNVRGQLGNNTVGDAQKTPVKVFTFDNADFDAGQAPSTVGIPIKVTTSVPAPTYSIVIPSTVNVGDLRQTSEDAPGRNSFTKFTIEATNVSNLFGEKEIQVSVNATDPSGSFYLEESSGSVLPFDLVIAPNAQTVIGSGDILARFTANEKVDAYIRIDQSKITESGIYNGVLIFSYTVTDID